MKGEQNLAPDAGASISLARNGRWKILIGANFGSPAPNFTESDGDISQHTPFIHAQDRIDLNQSTKSRSGSIYHVRILRAFLGGGGLAHQHTLIPCYLI